MCVPASRPPENQRRKSNAREINPFPEKSAALERYP